MTNEDIEQNLAAIAELASAHGEKLVLAGILPISDIDPATNTVAQQFYGPGGDAIRVGHGSVWLSSLPVWRLDPKRIEATLP
jgi:virginiamycin B lyase